MSETPAIDTGTTAAMARPRWLLRQVGPWMLGIAILAYLFTQVPLADAWEAARSARLGVLLSASLAAVTFWFLVESGAFAYLFTRFHVPFGWKEARSLRGSTYVLTPINWNVGTAAIILYLRQSRGVSALEATSTMMFYGHIDGMVVAALTWIGLSFLPVSPEVAQFQRIAGGATLVLLAIMGALLTQGPAWKWLQRMRSAAILRTYRTAGWVDVAALVGIRGAYFSVFALYFWAGSQAFHVELPLAVAAATMAVILGAQGLPLTPAGLGTMQAAMLYFWRPYGSEAAILAFALAFPICVTLSRMCLGLAYVPDIRGRLDGTPRGLPR